MKSIFPLRTAYLLPLALLGFLACSEPCDKVDCGDFGSCSEIQDEPNCICAAGYEQDGEERCTLRSTAKFTGTWTAEEVRTNNLTQVRQTLTYSVTIADDTDAITRLYLTNLGNFTCDGGSAPAIEASVSRNAFFIDQATYCPTATFSGYQFARTSGEIRTTRDTIKLNFRVTWNDQGSPADFSGTVTMYQ